MPTKHRRHAITETPTVQAALDALRGELGTARIELGELVIRGARAKLEELRAERQAEARRRIAERVLSGGYDLDVDAADEVKHHGLIGEWHPKS